MRWTEGHKWRAEFDVPVRLACNIPFKAVIERDGRVV